MSLITRFAFKISKLLYRKSNSSFKADLAYLEKSQKQILANLLEQSADTKYANHIGIKQNLNYQTFKNIIPVQSYKDIEPFILEQKKTNNNILGGTIDRYQPTSGSTSSRKWIPYTKEILAEFDHAIGPWLMHIFETYPKVLDGKHYWSLSWMPDELRAEMKSTDDLSYFSWTKRIFMKACMAVPGELVKAKTTKSAQLATIIYLVQCSDSSTTYICSPPFVPSLLHELKENHAYIGKVLETGT